VSIRAHASAPRLNARVTFQRAVADANGDITGWTEIVRDVHAAVDAAKASSAEREAAEGTRSVAGYTVWVRSDIPIRFGITVLDRVVWKGRFLNIRDIPDQGLEGRFIAMFCEAGVNKG
jgi:head-tail adaptor